VFDADPVSRQLLWRLFDLRRYEIFVYPDTAFCPLTGPSVCPCPPDTICADVIVAGVRLQVGNGMNFLEDLFRRNCRRPATALVSDTWTEADCVRAENLGSRMFKRPLSYLELIAWLTEVETVISPRPHLADWEQWTAPRVPQL